MKASGPLISIQDAGRSGFMRFGVPSSGPMDRLSAAAANAALGNEQNNPVIEISTGGLELECVTGELTFAIAGGDFIVEHAGERKRSWIVSTLRQGETLAIKPGFWGNWTYLAFAGFMEAEPWLQSHATHASSGFGGGKIVTGKALMIANPEVRKSREGSIFFPISARPSNIFQVILGPQDRFFSDATIRMFFESSFEVTPAYDRMGMRLRGPFIKPIGELDIPSEPIVRGSIQIAGDGIPTVLLADHQTTGGYPKLATMVDADTDRIAQLRPKTKIVFKLVTTEEANAHARRTANGIQHYLGLIANAERSNSDTCVRSRD
ncbi:biotin-dependent carboxyltransferase family protein [Brucella sp. YY2X]|uniref:Biotin-dependent carboxyltransferase family protein n=1 Tax=Ochrobactrum chromiisoli TaxID=2993941 RepID=A0ABT3QSD3_9HYPH|nr:biotin-dependent carboxyltransferase family protein [Ochrobactrum chromiisoli]